MPKENATKLVRSVGRRIAELRRNKDLTQAEFAELLGVSVQWVSRAEVGHENLTISTMAKVANALGVQVVVLFDELPVTSLMDARGRVDATLFPHFADLARTATWYRNTTAVSGATEQAVPAVLTGRYPREGLLPRFADHPRNLFTLLAGSHDLQVVGL